MIKKAARLHITPSRGAYTWHPTICAFTVVMIFVSTAPCQVTLQQLSSDTLTNSSSEHATEVSSSIYSSGSTVVAAFEVGRNFTTGSAAIGFSTSTNGGKTWTSGYLPGITSFYKGGQYAAAADPSVAYDAMHKIWMITSLGIGLVSNDVLASRSTDGLHWNSPVVIDSSSLFADKPWIACDNHDRKYYTHYGHCYATWDDAGLGDQIKATTSTDGGQNWATPYALPQGYGMGPQPVVAHQGIVTVPFLSSNMQYFVSTTGGKAWWHTGQIATVTTHQVAGGLRMVGALPSAASDSNGKTYVVWQDCRFRSSCTSNDIVMSTSTDGETWSAVSRIPIDDTSSTVDHFLPGLAVDPATGGNTAHLALTYYYYPDANCGTKTCNLSVGYVSSQDGGQTWTSGEELTSGMNLSWLPTTLTGYMAADYISTSYVNSKAYGVFAVATKPGSKYHQGTFAPQGGLLGEENGPFYSSAEDRPVPDAKSDHDPWPYWDLQGRLPRNRSSESRNNE